MLKEHPSYKDDEEIQGDPCIIFFFAHTVTTIILLLIHD